MTVAALSETNYRSKSKTDYIFTATYAAGWLGLIATGALITANHFNPSPEMRQAILDLGLLTIGLKTVSLSYLGTRLAQRRKKPMAKSAKEHIALLAQSKTHLLIGDMDNPDQNKAAETISENGLVEAQRTESLAAIIRLASPTSFSAHDTLKKTQRLFPLATSISGISLRPKEKEMFFKFLQMLPVVPPDKHSTSDGMVSYFSELANLYARILAGYVHQTSVDLSDPAKSLRMDAIQRALWAERAPGHIGGVTVPIGIETQAKRIDQLKSERSLIDGKDALIMTKLLVSVWFRALPAARLTSIQEIISLKRQINNLLFQPGLTPERQREFRILLEVLNLPDNINFVFAASNVNDPTLKELIERIQKTKQAEKIFAGLSGQDTSLRGRVQTAIKHNGIDIVIEARGIEDSCITITSANNILTPVEETAISMALLFPGIKRLRIILRDYQTLDLDLDEFYSKRIIDKNTSFLRSRLTEYKRGLALN